MASPSPIHLIVGLGNPGPRYSGTRHNAGAWLIEEMAKQHNATLKLESKFKATIAKITINEQSCWIAIPTTYMNESGQAISQIAKFYKIPPESILVAHDELDFPPGTVKIKSGGGHGGHNGLRDTIRHLHSNDFHRIRLGIGHPGHAKEVHDYVLHSPSKSEQQAIDDAIWEVLRVVPEYINGDQQKAVRELHNREGN